jgi:hypothetical protein
MSDNKNKNLHAEVLGRLGGLKGGPARAKTLSPERRREIAREAVRTRWNKEKEEERVNIAKKIVDKFGGQSALARLLGKKRATVHRWVKIGIIPTIRQPEIIRLAEENGIGLCPSDFDIFPARKFTMPEIEKIRDELLKEKKELEEKIEALNITIEVFKARN